MDNFCFQTVQTIVFGQGCISEIGKRTAVLGTRVLLVTGRTFLRRTGRLDEILRYFEEQSLQVVVFERVPPEPPICTVDKAVQTARDNNCNVVVAVGGGSVIDVGKATAALFVSPVGAREHFYGREVGRKGLPFVAVPTTAGSGAEVTPNSVLIDSQGGVKASIRSAHMLPDVAIVDPTLTISLPAEETASSGMDALSQALEALVSRGANPLTDALAGDAAARIITNLPLVYRRLDDLHLRTEVALGSLMGGMAFANARLGLVHGVAHPLGVTTGLPHGIICALLLPYVIRFNTPLRATKYASLARRVRLVNLDCSDEKAALTLADAMEDMNQQLGIKKHQPKLHISSDKWPAIIEQTLQSGSAKSNPREVSYSDVEALLKAL